MAELETEEEVIETTPEVVENNEELEQGEFDNITVEDYKALLERNRKAEAKLVELKKQSKTKPDITNSREEVKKMFLEEKFYEKNPDAENYRAKIEEYQTVNKLPLEDAYELAIRKDKEIEENRKVYGKGLVKGNVSATEGITLVTPDEYLNMTDEQINKYDSDMKDKYGVVKFK